MRKISVSLRYNVPSWNFCNLDAYTDGFKLPRETCRFCKKEKNGYKCLLYDEGLTSDELFINKTSACIRASAGYSVEIEPRMMPPVDPKLIIRETLAGYKKLVDSLLKQGYPRSMAESLAQRYMLEDK